MSNLLKIAGLILAMFCWFNPAGLDAMILLPLFILAFDMMGMWMKLIVFVISVAFPIFGDAFGSFSWMLLFMFGADAVLKLLEIERPYKVLVKPVAVFAVAFFAIGLQPALVIAGIDLLINLTSKIKSPKKKSNKKNRKRKNNPKQAEVA